jgi:hypothetical protein
MDAIFTVALSVLAVLGLVTTIAGVESRDGFDNARLDARDPID